MENKAKSKPFVVGEQFEVEILRLSAGGGRGVAKIQDFVVFVPLTAPGDIVKVALTKVQKSFAEAKILEIVKPSEARVNPPCPVFEDCGGCTLQMLEMAEQHKQKEGFLNFVVQSVFSDEAPDIDSIQGSSKAFRYRNRIQIHQEGKSLGFYKKGSHKLVRVEDCLITDERIVAKFPELKRQNRKRRVEIAVSSGGQVLKSEKALGPEQALFSQVNADLNKVLVQFIIEEANKIPGKLNYIQDLYCGSGNFSFPLAHNFSDAKVTGVELSKSSVLVAKEKNTLENLKFIAGDVAKYLNQLGTKKGCADLILVDPPRKGMSNEVVGALLKSDAKHIFYISCNLASASRDLRMLKEKYKLVKAKPFDMFPQTDHLESFFSLELR